MNKQYEAFLDSILQLDPYKGLSSGALYALQAWARKIKEEAPSYTPPPSPAGPSRDNCAPRQHPALA